MNNETLDDYLNRLELYGNALERNAIGHLEPSCTIRANVVRAFVRTLRNTPLQPKQAAEWAKGEMVREVERLDTNGVITDDWKRLLGRQLAHEAGNVIDILNKSVPEPVRKQPSSDLVEERKKRARLRQNARNAANNVAVNARRRELYTHVRRAK